MSDKIARVTPREIAEMLVNEQAYADTQFVLADEHEAEIKRVREAPEAAASAARADDSATSELYRRLRAEKAVARLSDILSERDRKTERLHRKIERLRARVALLEQALGLLTTLAPKMEIDVSDPLGMARGIEATVRAALEAKP